MRHQALLDSTALTADMALLLAILPFPPELLITILTLLDIGDLCTCRRVSSLYASEYTRHSH